MRKLVVLLIAAAALCGAATPAAVALGHWSTKAPMPLARTESAVAALDGRIYVIGGFGPGADQRAVQVYDAARDRWSLGTPLPVGLNHAGAHIGEIGFGRKFNGGFIVCHGVCGAQ